MCSSFECGQCSCKSYMWWQFDTTLDGCNICGKPNAVSSSCISANISIANRKPQCCSTRLSWVVVMVKMWNLVARQLGLPTAQSIGLACPEYSVNDGQSTRSSPHVPRAPVAFQGLHCMTVAHKFVFCAESSQGPNRQRIYHHPDHLHKAH